MRLLSSLRRWGGQVLHARYRWAWLTVFVLIVIVGIAGPGHVSWAADPEIGWADATFASLVGYITSIVQALTAAVATLSLNFIEMLVGPILQYNNFTNSPTIDLGWSLIRDVLNMFVVVVLIVMAVGTIVGYKSIHWEQQLPQFLLAVVLMNFSRTICGILIDISQVVMLTFVNALLDVAAGNFATMLGYDHFGEYSLTAVYDPVTGGTVSIDAVQQLGAAYLQFILIGAIAAVLLLLALVYLWRIVLLWILVITSPINFFMSGMKGMFHFADGIGGEWTKQFTASLMLGPMLTFFLWLSLSTATGDIFQKEGFVASPAGVPVTLKSFESSEMVSTLLGLILLIVGMQQSASFAKGMGGVAAKYINEDTGRKIISGIPRAIGSGAAATLRYGDRQVGRLAGLHEGIVMDRAGKYGRAISNQAAKVPWVGGSLARGVAGATGYIQEPFEHAFVAQKKAAKDRVGHYTDDQLIQNVSSIAAGNASAIGLNADDDIEAIKIKALTDGDFRKKLKKNLKDETNKENPNEVYDKFMTSVLKVEEGAVKAAGGDVEKITKAKNQSLHLLRDAEGNLDKGAVRKVVQSDKFNPRDLSDEAVENADVLRELQSKIVRITKEGDEITAYDELIKGVYGTPLRDKAEKTARSAGMEVPARERPRKNEQQSQATAATLETAAVAGLASQGFARPPRNNRGGGNRGGGSSGSGGNSGGGSGGSTPPPSGGGGGAGPVGGGGAGGEGGTRAAGEDFVNTVTPARASSASSAPVSAAPTARVAPALATPKPSMDKPRARAPQVLTSAPIDVDAPPTPRANPLTAAPIDSSFDPRATRPTRPPRVPPPSPEV